MGAGVKALHFSTVDELCFCFLARPPAIWRMTRRMSSYPQEGERGRWVIRDTSPSSKLFKEQAPLNQYVSV